MSKNQFPRRCNPAVLAFVCAALSLATTASAQSSRPGWGSTPYHDAQGTGVTFRVWAPNATSVYVPGQFNSWSTTATPLVEEQTNGAVDGVWSADVTSASPGQQYKYYINYNGGGNWKHDPCSRWVTFPGGGSGNNDIIYDPTAFNWNGDNFTNPALNDLFVYELHIGTFYTNGSAYSFLAATNKLNYLKSLGVSAVEVMPIAEFGNNGNSEGYDPAQPFAVQYTNATYGNASYGGPDGFKTFVQACHARGLAVLLDVVHNHYGTGDLDMWDFDGFAGTNSQGGGGIYFFQTPANINLQITPYGATRPNFNSQQVDNYVSNNIVMWLSEYHVDGFRWDDPYTLTHGNDGTYIPNAGNLLQAINNMTHANYPGKISIAEDVINTWGFDSSWDTGYPGYFTPVLTNTVDANRNMNTVTYAIQNDISYQGYAAGFGRVVYLESHDVVYGPNGGERLVTAIDPTTPNSYRARKLSTLGATVTLTAPGVPMIFQGQEMLESNAFYSYTPVDWTKTNTYKGIVQLYRDLITARRDLKGYTPGLEGDQCSVLWSDNNSKLVAFHRWKSGTTNQDAVVIANFANVNYPVYNLNFPYAGTWYVHFNTDSTNYSSDFGNNGSTVVTAGGNPVQASVAIGPYSALILSPTPDAPPQLTIRPTNGTVNVSWSNTYSEWLLDSSTTLAGNPPPWTQVSTSQYQTNSTTIFINTNSSSGATFYRLRKL